METVEVLGITVQLPQILDTLNRKISILIDQDHQIGHSYLMNANREQDGNLITNEQQVLNNLKFAFYNEIFPLIQEYFYNDLRKIRFLLGESFVKEVKSLDDAQQITEEATQGIYQIIQLEGPEFINALNTLLKVEYPSE